jgi:hypothetical protein
MRYELFENANNLLPITFNSFWTKTDNSIWKIKIEYQLRECSLRNISFTTKLTTNKNSNEQFVLINSEPKAKFI